jgi:small subunit ribosomal protein S6
MPLYETTFILNPQLEDSAIDGRIKETIGIIEKSGGKILKENRIGTRRLAYELARMSQGYYVDLIFEGNATVPRELETRYRLEDDFLRHLTCRYEGKIGQEEEQKEERPKRTAESSDTGDESSDDDQN